MNDTTMSGMDTQAVRSHAASMEHHAEAVLDLIASLTRTAAELPWNGADSARFLADWNGSFAPQEKGAVGVHADNAKAMRAQAQRQDQVSA